MARQALLNYSTKIEAGKTASEIQEILGTHGAKAVLINYKDGLIDSLSFQVETPQGDIGFRLPIDPDAVLKILQRQQALGKLRHGGEPDRPQAVRVAWRILKDWIEAQMAILETEMVKIEQVFLPYMITHDGRTLYEGMAEKGFYLTQGRNEHSD